MLPPDKYRNLFQFVFYSWLFSLLTGIVLSCIIMFWLGRPGTDIPGTLAVTAWISFVFSLPILVIVGIGAAILERFLPDADSLKLICIASIALLLGAIILVLGAIDAEMLLLAGCFFIPAATIIWCFPLKLKDPI
ncbi:hypothetical protein MKQ68_15960 [Chitinophaga horti]|uniref:Uncharacterized protein n=1 Tax=Chitinophaga horti TaxID=2920382 RepID=A0ABY6IW34_9BACT|nr:hypothetical protein [Chitinophaga horti]UYQ91587.1 hypothetical protein MKQ68_15960 [Chitinophaga horti]